MSLFRVREWWATQISENNGLDRGLLAIGCLTGTREQVVVGSHSGIVRVFDPGRKESEAPWQEYRADDLLLEKQLPFPVLQLGIGHFVSSSYSLQLVTLHPRKLVVYSFSEKGKEAVEHGHQFDLEEMYSHNLQRTAFNMVHGPFGGNKGLDSVCVQSVDGCLSVYERENFAFTRFLPNSLLPGPLAYLPMADSFVTVSSTWQVESYKYHMLAVATDTKTREEAESIVTGKRVIPDWVMEFGEEGIDIGVIEMSPAQPSIFILGRKTLLCLTHGGTPRFQKRLDFLASQILPYCATSEGYIQHIIVTQTNSILFFSDTTLRWAAQLSFSPIELKLVSFG